MTTIEDELMAFRKKGLASYGEVEVQSGTAYADSVQLIQMLFDGLNKGKGSYWAKKSSLLRLGFYASGNMAEGIIPVNFRNE